MARYSEVTFIYTAPFQGHHIKIEMILHVCKVFAKIICRKVFCQGEELRSKVMPLFQPYVL